MLSRSPAILYPLSLGYSKWGIGNLFETNIQMNHKQNISLNNIFQTLFSNYFDIFTLELFFEITYQNY